MKEVTLKFREVAVDGLPEESMQRAIVIDSHGLNCLPYSSIHELFNCHDFQRPTAARANGLAFANITHWCPASEIEAAMKEDTTHAD